jgi:hypothetical protein
MVTELEKLIELRIVQKQIDQLKMDRKKAHWWSFAQRKELKDKIQYVQRTWTWIREHPANQIQIIENFLGYKGKHYTIGENKESALKQMQERMEAVDQYLKMCADGII